MIGGDKGQKWIAVVRGPVDDEPTTLPKGVRRRWKRGIPLFFFLLPLPPLPPLFLITFSAFCSPPKARLHSIFQLKQRSSFLDELRGGFNGG